MKRINFIDRLQKVSADSYRYLVEKIIKEGSRHNCIVSIYQIGSVSNPGISDLDLVFVFKNGISCDWNPRNNLTKEQKYVLVHNCFGAGEEYFKKAQFYSFFNNYRIIYGRDLLERQMDLSIDNNLLKRQVALEYLIKMFITLTIQMEFGTVKLRSLLLEAKAIKYDLEFLEIEKGELYNLVWQIIRWRNDWFNNTPSDKNIAEWIKVFYRELWKFLNNILENTSFYLPKNEKFALTDNIKIINDNKLQYKRTGIRLPGLFLRNRKLFNINNKLSHFEFYVPWKSEIDIQLIQKRFDVLKAMQDYNKKHIPHFSPLSSSFNI